MTCKLYLKVFRKERTGANIHIKGFLEEQKIKSIGQEQVLKIKIQHDSLSMKRSET